MSQRVLHQPHGIDDPYKFLPTERRPRDPQPGETVRVNFQAQTETAKLEITHQGQTTTVQARPLGADLWTAELGQVQGGSYGYDIVTAEGERAGPFTFTVGQWCQVTRVHDVQTTEHGVTLTCEVEGREQPAFVTLCVPATGVCRLEFNADSRPTPDGLPCSVRQAGQTVHLQAEGLELQLDLDALTVQAGQARASLRFRWLSGGSDLTRIETSFGLGQEPLYGLGERFDDADKRGREYDVRVYEEYKEQGRRTYLPVPFVVSPEGWGVWLEADEPNHFDLRGGEGTVRLQKLPEAATSMRLHLISADTPYGVTGRFVGMNGGMAVPPKWAFGPWMSSNDWNNQARTEAVIRRTVAEDIPATVLVLEAWSDESTFYIWNDAQYTPRPGAEAFRAADFTFGGRWPDPKAMIDECHQHGIRVVLWQIPVQKHVPEDHAQHHADEAHMEAQGFGVKQADGRAYRCQGWWFTDGLVMDFTNPAARDWWFGKRAYLFSDLGIDGMKTDGGEHLWGRDLRMHDGRRGLEMFNAYPNSYVGAYYDFIQQRTGGDGLTFSRAGYTGAGRYPAHWAGDENSTWNALKASIQAGLSAGVSGVSMWTWDIGGFSGDIPSVELYLRSVAFGAFCPLMQYHSEWNPAHENRDRTPWNIAERHQDGRALSVYRQYAKLRMRLLDYLHAEARAMGAEGLPLMRYPGLVYPQQREWLEADPHAYLLGRDLLVCPVVEKGALARDVRLPPGKWLDFWTGTEFQGAQILLMPAPIDVIPVFVKADSPRASQLRQAAQG